MVSKTKKNVGKVLYQLSGFLDERLSSEDNKYAQRMINKMWDLLEIGEVDNIITR